MSDEKYEVLNNLSYLELYNLPAASNFTHDEILEYIKQNRELDLKILAAVMPLYKFDQHNILFYKYLHKIKNIPDTEPIFTRRPFHKQKFKKVGNIKIYEPIFNYNDKSIFTTKYNQLSSELYFMSNIFREKTELTENEFDDLIDEISDL